MAERINAVKTSFFGKGAIRLLGPEHPPCFAGDGPLSL